MCAQLNSGAPKAHRPIVRTVDHPTRLREPGGHIDVGLCGDLDMSAPDALAL